MDSSGREREKRVKMERENDDGIITVEREGTEGRDYHKR